MAANTSRLAPGSRPMETDHLVLTYSVYTVSEHDAQRATSRRSLPPVPPPPPPTDVTWTDARRALHDREVLFALIRCLPWRRIGFGAAITGGAFLVFLFAVVTVAELTDDLKPARKSSSSRIAPPVVAPALPIVVAAVVAPAASAIEVDEAPPPPPVKKPTAKAKAKAKPKKAPAPRFFP